MIKTLKQTISNIYYWIKKKLIRFKKWLILIIFGATILAAPLVLPTVPDIALEKIQQKYNASDIKDKYRLEKTAFILDAIDENAIQAEVGNKNLDEFIPELTLRKWDDECNFKVKYKHNEKKKDQKIDIEDKKIKWKGKKTEVHYYDLKKGELLHDKVLEHDVYEVEVLLLEKPDTNIVAFDIETKGLAFYYQPELTQKEKDEGAFRPENVIGSYAVYHESKANNTLYQIDKNKYTQEELNQMVLDKTHIGKTNDKGEVDYLRVGKKYKTGKAFHIYRPRIIDSVGTEVWGELNITDNLLTVTIPQEFLDNAVYPIRHAAGLTFGYETQGTTSWQAISYEYFGARKCRWGNPYSPESSGTVDNIKAYLSAANGTDAVDVKVLINEKDSEGANSHGQIAIKENLNCSGAAHWEQFDLNSESVTGGVDYVLNIVGEQTTETYRIAYDSGSIITYKEAYAPYTTPDNPWDVSDSGYDDILSIYCTYQAGAADARRMFIVD